MVGTIPTVYETIQADLVYMVAVVQRDSIYGEPSSTVRPDEPLL